MHIRIGVHTGHTALANFYIGPVKKLMLLCGVKCFNGGLNHIICRFHFHLIFFYVGAFVIVFRTFIGEYVSKARI